MSSTRANRAARGPARRLGDARRRVSLTETLDRVLNKGAVVVGDVILSVAGIDLVYLGVNLVLCSVETMRDASFARGALPASEIGAPRAPR